MHHCGIVIATPNAKFGWAEGYNTASNSEIRELTVECDYALGSLQYEHSIRQGLITPNVALTLDSCYKNLQTNSQRIQQSGLNDNDLRQLADEAEEDSAHPSIIALQKGLKPQAKSRDGWKKDAYDELLWIVSRLVSPAHALLVRCSVGKLKVTNLNLGGRAKLVQYVRQNEGSLSCYALHNKAVELGLCHDGGDPDSQLVTASKKRKNDEGVILRSQTSNFTSRLNKPPNRSTVPHSPSSPRALLVAENLFRDVKVYFEKSCRDMILDDHETLLAPNGAALNNDLCNDFDSYTFTATMLMKKGMSVEFRRALSKASALVKPILKAEHPRTLACFLEVFIHLIQARLPEVTSFLRAFIKSMSAELTGGEQHLWGRICRLLGELDSEFLDQAMAQIWKCITDIFDSSLGTFNRLAVSVRLDYIKRVYGTTDSPEEERLLRHLLVQFGGIPRLPTPRVMLNLAHNMNRQGHYDKAETMALEVLSLLQKYEIYAGRIVERIESLKIIFHSQFNQGKTPAAEETLREVIKRIVDQYGRQHSWVPEFKSILEGWLRSWGREEEANTLRGEIQELMVEDEIGEQLDRCTS